MNRIAVAILVLLLASSARAVTHYANIAAETNGDGTVGSPWKTLANVADGLDALVGDGDGDTVELAAGDYGPLDDDFWRTARVTGITLAAAAGAAVYFSNEGNEYVVDLLCGTSTDVKLTISGIKVWCDNPDPLPADDGMEHFVVGGVRITNANGVQFTDCDIKGPPYRWLCSSLVKIEGTSADTVFSGCLIHHTGGSCVYLCGTNASNLLDNVTFTNCQIYHAGEGGNLRFFGFVGGDVLIDRCLIGDNTKSWFGQNVESDEPYVPWDVDTQDYYHMGTALGVRACQVNTSIYGSTDCWWDSFTIRRSIILHTGTSSQSMYLYSGSGKFSGMTFESSFFTGTTEWFNLCPTAEKPVTIRNNLYIGYPTEAYDTYLTRNYLTNRWNNSYGLTLHADAEGSWANTCHYNNIVVAQTSYGYFPVTQASFTSNGNLFWATGAGSDPATSAVWAGAKDVFAVWNIPPLHGNPNFFGDIGWTNADNGGPTAEYNSTTNGVTEIFTSVTNHDFTLNGNTAYLSGEIDPAANGDLSVASAYTIGGFDENGYIQAGVGRTVGAGTCSVGPFEAAEVLGKPLRPMLLTPCDGVTNQSIDVPLAWSWGMGAATYKVYLGTDEALVTARNAATLLDTVSVLTYDPTLAEGTTYYWTVDSVDASSNVGKGWIHTFTTSDIPDPPGDPTGFSPADDALDVAVTAACSWTNGSDTSTVDVYFSTDETLVSQCDSTVRKSTGTLETSYDPTGSMLFVTTYYWRVVCINDEGSSQSAVQSFTTAARSTSDKPVLAMRPKAIFYTDADCVSLWLMEDLTSDSVGTNTLSGADVTTSTTHIEGSTSAYFKRSLDSYRRVLNGNLSSDFPGLDGSSNSTFSVCFWFRPDTLPTSTGTWYMVGKDNGSTERSWAIAVRWTGTVPVLSFIQGHTNGTDAQLVDHASTLVADRWYHVGVTYTNATKTATIRIWDYTAAEVLGSDISTVCTNAISMCSSAFIMGRRGDYNYGNDFDGYLDEVAIFKRALSSAEIDTIRGAND